MIIIGIVVSIILFSIIVLIHEFGHFKAARFFGVKVEEFGLGIPPRAKKIFTDNKGTIFTFNWLPLGGFVRLKGENSITTKDIKDKDNLMNISPWKQAIVMLAGVFMNFILAFIIFSILFFIGVKPLGINTKVETQLDLKIIPNMEQALKSGLLEKKEGIILYPIKGSIAEKAGIKQGDILYSILICKTKMLDFAFCEGGESPKKYKVNNPNFLIEKIKENAGKRIAFHVNIEILENKKYGGSIIGIYTGADGKIGSYLSENIKLNKNFKYKYGFVESIKYGAIETYGQSLLTFKAIGILFRKLIFPKEGEKRSEAIKQVSGPIGLVDLISNSLSAGFMFLIILTALISINLGVFNLLPIPALDGGRFLFISINGVIKSLFGKKAINEKVEIITNLIFFAFLIFLSIIITYNDIINIIEK